jgi:hypothetical protein
MLNLVVFSDVLAAFNKNTVFKEFSTPPCLNRVLQDSRLALQLLAILPSLKFSLVITFSLLLTKSSIKLLNTGTDQEDNFNAGN